MFQTWIPVISQINPKVLIGLAIVVIVLFVISILKKAVKAGILLFLLCAVLCGGVPTVNMLRENYGISYSRQDEVLSLKMGGNVVTVPLKEMKESKKYSIRFEPDGATTKMNLFYQKKDNTAVSASGSSAIKIPSFMLDTITKYLDETGLSYTVEEGSALPR